MKTYKELEANREKLIESNKKDAELSALRSAMAVAKAEVEVLRDEVAKDENTILAGRLAKAEADLAVMTMERDTWKKIAAVADEYRPLYEQSESAIAAARKAMGEKDEACKQHWGRLQSAEKRAAVLWHLYEAVKAWLPTVRGASYAHLIPEARAVVDAEALVDDTLANFATLPAVDAIKK